MSEISDDLARYGDAKRIEREKALKMGRAVRCPEDREVILYPGQTCHRCHWVAPKRKMGKLGKQKRPKS